MEGATALVLAAGVGERLGGEEPKAFLELSGRTLLWLATGAAASCAAVSSVVVLVPAGMEERASGLLVMPKPVKVAAGGPTRQASVLAGLALVGAEVAAVVCHDAARPFARPELFEAVLAELDDADGAVPVTPVPDTIKRVRDGFVVSTEPRELLSLAQTPQAFRTAALRDAHVRAAAAELEFTDDAAALEWAGYRVRAVPGDPGNFKVTTLTDLARAETIAAEVGRE